MRIFHPVSDWWFKALFASRIFAFLEIRPSDRRERAIRQSMTGGVGFLLKEAKKWIAKNKGVNKNELNFAVEIKGQVVGGIGLMDIKPHKAEIGYWLARKYWSEGIMTEAVRLVTGFAFKKLKLKRVYAHVFSRNKPSQRVLEKNKYKREGLMKKYHLKDGKLFDAIIYARTR